VCDAAATGQLLPQTTAWIEEAQRLMSSHGLGGILAVEIAENVPATERACHLDLESGVDPEMCTTFAEGLVGISAHRADRPDRVWLSGHPIVTDVIDVGGDQSCPLRLSRNVRAFFQGNRFLLEELVRRVAGLVPGGPVVDLYAGVGLFALFLAVAGREHVIAVEGDPVAGADLVQNAASLPGGVKAVRQSVESYLAGANAPDVAAATVIVDPPRTGLSKDAIGHLVRLQPQRVIYIACDVATLARDTRRLLAEGYSITHLSSIDLFPNTAHVETLAAFGR
jgi:23S rRNA (uracil1939-C5)-methyltransferase